MPNDISHSAFEAMTTSKALIIAAGRGMRLNEHSHELPKCLIRIGEKPIIEYNLEQLKVAGIKDVVIVTGYKGEIIQKYLTEEYKGGLRFHIINNQDWQKKNGVSVLSAKVAFEIGQSFLLLMSDHVFQQNIIVKTLHAPLLQDQLLLAVDKKIENIYDEDDAMKVMLRNDHIRAIGKELTDYNAIDCGLFKANYSLFSALENALKNDDCALVDGCNEFVSAQKMIGVDIGDAKWIDIDTPETLQIASKFLTQKDVYSYGKRDPRRNQEFQTPN